MRITLFFEVFMDINVQPQVPVMFFMTFYHISLTVGMDISALHFL